MIVFYFFVQTLIEEAHGKSSFMGTIIIQMSVSFSHQKLSLLTYVLSLKKYETFNISPNITHVHGCIGLVKCTKLRRRSKGYRGNKHKPKNYWR